MTRQTDYAAVAHEGRIVQTFSEYDLAERFAADNPHVTIHRRTVTMTPVDARGRFTTVRQGVRLEVRT
jgi:hypothetical protein